MTNCIGNKCVISVNDSTEWLAIFAFFILSVSLISNVGSPMSKVYSLLYDNSTRRTTSWIINRHWFRIGWIIYCSVLSISGFNVWRTTTNGVDILTTTTTTTITKTTLKIYLVILIIHFCSGWLLQELDSLPWLLLAMNLLLFFSNCVNSTGLWRADISAGLLSILCLIWNSFSIVVILTLSIGVKKAPSKLQSGSLWSRSSPLKANAIAIEPGKEQKRGVGKTTNLIYLYVSIGSYLLIYVTCRSSCYSEETQTKTSHFRWNTFIKKMESC